MNNNVETWDKDNVQWQRARAMYAASGIFFEEREGHIVKVIQKHIGNGLILNQKELIERGRTLYPDKAYKITPITYPLEADTITPEWVQEQMELFGLKGRDLAHQLGMTPSSLSLAINGRRPLSISMKSQFFYYFLSQRLARINFLELTADELNEALEHIRKKRSSALMASKEQASPDISPE